MQTAEEFVRESKYPETAFIDALRARDAEWQARVEKLEAAINYAVACLPEAPLNAKEKLRAALGREA